MKLTVFQLPVIFLVFFIISITKSDPTSSTTTASPEWVGIPNPCLCQEFRCSNGTFCLHKSRVCSGFKDCPNGEDELQEYCRPAQKLKCSGDEFKCKFGGCIKFTQVCDKVVDCWGGVDEASDFCSWSQGGSISWFRFEVNQQSKEMASTLT